MSECKHGMQAEWCDFCASPRPAQQTPAERCRACGRPLRDALSRHLGIGPVCFRDDHDAQERFVRAAKASDTQAMQFAYLPESTARQWQVALNKIDGLTAQVQLGDDGTTSLHWGFPS